MKTNYLIVLLCFLVFTTGCESTMSTKGWNTPAKGDKNSFYIYANDSTTNTSIKEIFDAFNISDDTQKSICPEVEYTPGYQEAAPGLIPLLSALGKYIFDEIQNSKAKQIKALKKASTATYSSQLFLEAGALKQARCIVMIRSKGEQETPEHKSIIVAKLVHIKKGDPSVFTLVPTYVKADNSLAITKKVKNEKPKINMAIALAVKAVGNNRDTGLESIALLGGTSISVPNIELGADGKELCKADTECKQSEMIPHLTDDSAILSVTMSVTEVGITGIDFDQREAEIKALKDAFGPAIQEALKAELPKN